jgi:hypothetical protein
MLWLNPWIRFGGYKLSHIQALNNGKFNIGRKDTLEKFHFMLSLQLFVLECMNFLCSTPKLFLVCDEEPHWLLHVILSLRRIEVVEGKSKDLFFLFLYVSLHKFVIYVLMLIILIEVLFCHPIDILKIFELLSMWLFVMYFNGLF